MSELLQKYFRKFEVKEISEKGSFEGILSPYGNIDHGRDVVEPGAYAKTLKERGTTIKMLWQHDEAYPIGTLELEDRADGLYCKGQICMDLPKGKEAYLCLKNRIIDGLSIGYKAIKDSIENGVRHLKEIQLFEGSVVTFQMNDLARVTAIKAREGKSDFATELEEIQTLSGYYQMLSALSSALSSVVWSDATIEDKTTMANSILTQFTETFGAFFPTYLAAIESAYGPSETWSANIDPEIKTLLAAKCVYYAGTGQALAETKAGKTTLDKQAAENAGEPGNHSNQEKELAILGKFRGLFQ